MTAAIHMRLFRGFTTDTGNTFACGAKEFSPGVPRRKACLRRGQVTCKACLAEFDRQKAKESACQKPHGRIG